MVPRLGSATESTPVSDSAVGQRDGKTTASRDRKRKSSHVKAVREEDEEEEVGCHKSRRLRHASSRPDRRHEDAPSQPSLVLATPAPLGRTPHPRTTPHFHTHPRPHATRHLTVNHQLTREPPCYDGEASNVDVARGSLLPPHESGDKKPFGFFDFPAEIRNIIYDHILRWPDCVDLYRSFYRQIPAYPTNEEPHSSQYRYQRSLRTPTILLLCRRITVESLPILKSRWLVIDRLPPFVPGGLMKITDFIGRRTLQSLNHIDLRIGLGEGPLGSGWIWTRLLDEVLAVLKERNSLVKLRLLVRMCDDQMVSRWEQEWRYSREIKKKMRMFEMANPNVFAPGEIIVETWRIEGETATFVSRYTSLSDEETSPPPDRTYPDREMFPGSIMQFVEALPASAWSDAEVASRLGGG
ncbi:hypothetical protein VSDG_00434 [Cytospora chrysosperma]|uniref:Uncharacterized protein n=1 Tax=Cytospora chrysosperma TaxID=252740 RepID=A0A423WPM5_CYTCH|nr:hypothetical protein VSDG_00434 [Valsa sordida]